MNTFNYPLVGTYDIEGNGVGVSMTDPVISPVINVTNILMLSIQASWTGTPMGTLKLQSSNTKFNGTEIWSDVTMSSFVVNGPGDILYNLSEIGYCKIRLVYTPASSTGTLFVSANGKGM